MIVRVLVGVRVMVGVRVTLGVGVLVRVGVTVGVAVIVRVLVMVKEAVGLPVGSGAQDGNLNDAMRVLQLKLPLAWRYSVAYQKVQSSTGSTLMLE